MAETTTYKNQKKRKLKKSPLWNIVERDNKGEYVKRARLYQDILSYFVTANGTPDTFWNLAKWLIYERNSEFHDYYTGDKSHTKQVDRIREKRDKIENALEKLLNLWLLAYSDKKPAEKNKALLSKTYVITPLGRIADNLVTYGKLKDGSPEKKEVRDQILANILESLRWLRFDSVMKEFTITLWKKAIEKGYADSLMDFIYKILDKGWKSEEITTLEDAIQWSIRLHLEREPLRSSFKQIWLGALDSLPDEKSKHTIMLHDKTEIERRILEQHPASTWIKTWQENLSNPTKLTLYACCGSCKCAYPIVVDYYDYRKNMDSEGFIMPLVDCIRCNARGTVGIKADIPLPGHWIIV
jgi:hypothetical protein